MVLDKLSKEELMVYIEKVIANQKGKLHVCISRANKKLTDKIPSVSVWPFWSCVRAGCMEMRTSKSAWCYAVNMALREYQAREGHLYSNVGESWIKNSFILERDPDMFWREVEAAIMMTRFFRFHVAGDFVNADYFEHVCEIAKRQSHCKILAFTKKYSLVNDWIAKNGKLPENLVIIFSAWPGLPMQNPNGLKECHVIFKKGEQTYRDGPSYLCSGNCAECARGELGCYSAKEQQILIKQH